MAVTAWIAKSSRSAIPSPGRRRPVPSGSASSSSPTRWSAATKGPRRASRVRTREGRRRAATVPEPCRPGRARRRPAPRGGGASRGPARRRRGRRAPGGRGPRRRGRGATRRTRSVAEARRGRPDHVGEDRLERKVRLQLGRAPEDAMKRLGPPPQRVVARREAPSAAPRPREGGPRVRRPRPPRRAPEALLGGAVPRPAGGEHAGADERSREEGREGRDPPGLWPSVSASGSGRRRGASRRRAAPPPRGRD